MMLKRFSPAQRAAHFIVSVSIFMLLITGLPITFKMPWVFALFGGSNVTMALHRLFAFILTAGLACFGVYFVVERITAGKKDSNISLSPSFFIGLISDMVKDIAWTLGISKERPKAGKYDWIMVADIFGIPVLCLIEIVTGAVLWFPSVFVAENPALIFAFRTIHAGVAIFMVLFVLAHTTVLHLTPGNFPMNMSIFTGLMSKRKAESELAAWAEVAEAVEGKDEHAGFHPVGYFAAAVSFLTLILLAYTVAVMGVEGLAGLRADGNPVVGLAANLTMTILVVYLLVSVYGVIRGIRSG